MTKLEYLEFEASCAGSMNAAARDENRRKYKITESDLIDFYGLDYPGKKKSKVINIKTNKRKDLFTEEEIKEQYELLKTIFDDEDDCFIRIRCKETGEYYSYQTAALLDISKLGNILNKSAFSKKDLMFSLNTYNNMHNHSNNNIFTINSFAIDVDFKECRRLQSKTPKQILKMLEASEFDKSIPKPNVIEYGNNMRLIYVVEKAYSTRDVKSLVTRICNVIGDRLIDYGAKGQPITTFARVNNSINTRNNKKIKVIYLDIPKYTIKSLQKDVLPPLPDWYAEYKNKRSRRAVTSKVIDFGEHFGERSRSREYNIGRISDFFKIVEYFNGEVDGRRYMCFQVRNHAKLAGMSNAEAEEIMQQLNDRFKYPLKWNVIEQDTRNVERKQYYYKSEKILEFLAIDTELEELLELKSIVSDTEKARRHNIREKARQKAKYRNDEGLTKTEVKRRDEFIMIARLELQGLSLRAIAKELSKDATGLSRKINKVYDKINYNEILGEVKQGLYDDSNVAIG